jgi:hypothetical protein
MSFVQDKSNVESIADKSTEIKNEPRKKEIQSPSEFKNATSPLNLSNPIQSEEANKKEELKFFGVSEYYIKQISEELISKYGNYFLKTYDQKNLDIPPADFMARHNIKLSIRTKMVDWMLEVFHSLNSNEETIFCAVKIMDKFIWKSEEILKSEDIHLIGIVCIYIASKTYDMVPIQMNSLIHLIGHDMFDQNCIKQMEKKIIKTINFDLMCPNTYEFIQFILYDFYSNNKESIVALKLKKMLDILENNSIWMAKMCNHFEKYSSLSPIILSVACIIIVYDMMKDNCKSLTDEMNNFFKDWLKFLYVNIAKTPEVKSDVENIYKEIGKTYIEFQKMNLKSLVQFHKLYFD